jgi:hypothetical protein
VIELEAKCRSENDITLFPIPAMELKLLVTVGNASSGVIPLDLTCLAGGSVTIVLREKSGY